MLTAKWLSGRLSRLRSWAWLGLAWLVGSLRYSIDYYRWHCIASVSWVESVRERVVYLHETGGEERDPVERTRLGVRRGRHDALGEGWHDAV